MDAAILTRFRGVGLVGLCLILCAGFGFGFVQLDGDGVVHKIGSLGGGG